MGSGGVAIAALPTVICLKVPSSDGLGGEARRALRSLNQSNMFLPLGKARTGCPKIPPTLS